jgi:hypothetical protein
MLVFPSDHPANYSDTPLPYSYEYPSYDAPRGFDTRQYIPLIPAPDFRIQRRPPPPSNLLGLTLNSMPANITARMGWGVG